MDRGESFIVAYGGLRCVICSLTHSMLYMPQPALVPIVALVRRRPWRDILIQSLVAVASVLCLAPTFWSYNTVTTLIAAGAATCCLVSLTVLYSCLVSLFEYRDLLGVGGNNNVEIRPLRFIIAVACPLLGTMYWSWIQRDASFHEITDSITAGALKAVQWVFLFQAVS